jgi:hypothetical protein
MDRVIMPSFDKLNARNYHTWATRMQMSMEYKGLWSAVTGAAPSEVTPNSQSIRQDCEAKAFIGLHVSDNLLAYVTKAKSSKEAWAALKKVFQDQSNAHSLLLSKQLSELSMGSEEAVSTYAARALNLSEQLAAIGETVSDKQLAMAVLNGLPEGFEVTVQNILTSGDALEVNSIVSKLLLVENMGRSRNSRRVAEAAAAFYQHVEGSRGGPKCWKCGKPGHTKAQCRSKKSVDFGGLATC